jgi:hypothetical protein
MLAICAFAPALASAAITNAPGATEGDQYFEEVPNGGGSGGVNHGGSGGGGGGGASSVQPVAGTQALDQLGSDGKAAAALANSNRPPEQGNQGRNETSPSSQAASPTDGDGGMGIFFPLLIAGTAVVAIAYGLRRRLYPT